MSLRRWLCRAKCARYRLALRARRKARVKVSQCGGRDLGSWVPSGTARGAVSALKLDHPWRG